MRIVINNNFKIPSATAQQRRHGANGRTWRSPGLALAIATWRAALEPHAPHAPMWGAVALHITFYYHGRCSDPRRKTTRPDLDNLAKVVIDAMTAVGFWRDDSQVVSLSLAKYVVPWEEGVVIEVGECPEGVL